jgi:hypothetical protein
VSGWHNEQNTAADSTATASWNTTTSTFDATLSARYKSIAIVWTNLNSWSLAGIGFDDRPAGKQ